MITNRMLRVAVRWVLSLSLLLAVMLVPLLMSGCAGWGHTKAFSVVTGTVEGRYLDPQRASPGTTIVYNRYSDSLAPEKDIDASTKASIQSAVDAGQIGTAMNLLQGAQGKLNDAAGDLINKNRSLNEQWILTPDATAAASMSAAFFATRTPVGRMAYNVDTSIKLTSPVITAKAPETGTGTLTLAPDLVAAISNALPQSSTAPTNAPPSETTAGATLKVSDKGEWKIGIEYSGTDDWPRWTLGDGTQAFAWLAVSKDAKDWHRFDKVRPGQSVKTLNNLLHGSSYHMPIATGEQVWFRLQGEDTRYATAPAEASWWWGDTTKTEIEKE